MTSTARIIRYDSYGSIDKLYLNSEPIPTPAPDQVVVEVRAAGINPVDAIIPSGVVREHYPVTFPAGSGSDVAGVVVSVGSDVTEFTEGQEVLGYAWRSIQPGSHATHVSVPATQLILKPAKLSWDKAGSLYIAASTAVAVTRAADAGEGSTIIVSAAAGGVGTLTVQLLVRAGARVIGIASEQNHQWLRAHGVTPVAYDGDIRATLRAALGTDAPSAFIDLFGLDYPKVALDLGVSPERIITVVAQDDTADIGATLTGSQQASTKAVLTEIAALLADGEFDLPIEKTFPLEDFVAAFTRLAERHLNGKLVFIP